MSGDKPWPQVPVGNLDHTRAAVVIIGAGISGMCTAIDLIKRNNCRNFIILEKSSSIGGTWNDNRYPGCCCDVWSHLYSYSFEQKPDWTREYPSQEEILEYLRSVATKWGLFSHIRFNSEVTEGRWDEESNKWKVKVRVTGEKDSEFIPEYTITSDFLVSGVGQLNYPRYPDIEGLKDFKGKMMHSARWDWSYDLTGKRIGIIGNGATAAQILPEVLKVAKHVDIYQRTPNWVVFRQDAPVNAFWRGIYTWVPPVRWGKRAAMMAFREAFYDTIAKAESEITTLTKAMHEQALQKAFPNDEKMRDILTPKYHPGCKRIILSDDFFPALADPKCHLETRHINKITEKGIEVEGGEEMEYDLIVFATGFKTVDFMHPIKLYGSNGRALSDIWKGGARALYGTVLEDMPNFAMLYGPNTNLGHNSIILMIESQSRFINGMIGAVLEARKQQKSLALKPKKARLDEYNNEIQEILKTTNFNDTRCTSWYKTAEGKITNNWSGTVIEYQKLLSNVHWADFDVEGSGAQLLRGKKDTNVGRAVEEPQLNPSTLAYLVGATGVLAAVGTFLARGGSRYLNLKVK